MTTESMTMLGVATGIVVIWHLVKRSRGSRQGSSTIDGQTTGDGSGLSSWFGGSGSGFDGAGNPTDTGGGGGDGGGGGSSD